MKKLYVILALAVLVAVVAGSLALKTVFASREASARWDLERDQLIAHADTVRMKADSILRKARADSIAHAADKAAAQDDLRRARASAGVAQIIQHKLDSALAAGPDGVTASDSAAFWKRNFDASQLVIARLEVSITQYEESVAGWEKLDAERVKMINDLMGQLSTANLENENLSRKLATSEGPCKFLWVVPCVSRTTVGVVVGGVATVGGILIGRASK